MTTEEITNYIFLEDQDLRADIAFVFGTWNAWRESIEKAAELYKGRLVPKVIVSGGLNKQTGVVEGDLMVNELVNSGVPREDILVENRSTNTLENVLFPKDVIDNMLGLDSIKVITAVVKNFHARRVLMTLKKHMPTQVFTVHLDPTSPGNWITLIKSVPGELDLLVPGRLLNLEVHLSLDRTKLK